MTKMTLRVNAYERSFKVNTTTCLKAAGIGPSLPQDLIKLVDDGWMDVLVFI